MSSDPTKEEYIQNLITSSRERRNAYAATREHLCRLRTEKQSWALQKQARIKAEARRIEIWRNRYRHAQQTIENLCVKIQKYKSILEACKPLVLDAIEAKLRYEAETEAEAEAKDEEDEAEAKDKNEPECEAIKEKALTKCEELFLIEE